MGVKGGVDGATVSEISAGSIQSQKSDFTSFKSERRSEVGIITSEKLKPLIPYSTRSA